MVSAYVNKEEKSIKQICEETLKLNKMILKNVTDVLKEIKKLEYFLKYEKDLKVFKANYETYRDILFSEGTEETWEYVNDVTAKHNTKILRKLVFSP